MIKTDSEVRGFTLIEILVAITILSAMVMGLATVTGRVSDVWGEAAGETERRIAARALLDVMAKELTSVVSPVPMAPGNTPERNLQLLINIPPGGGTGGIEIPKELLSPHAIFFQAPAARNLTKGNLAEIGYFLWWNGTSPSLYRYSSDPSDLDRYLIYTPSENWPASALSSGKPDEKGWLSSEVIALWIRALDKTGKPILKTAEGVELNRGYGFDSLQGYTDPSTGKIVAPPAYPPCIEICIVVIDSKTAKLLQSGITAEPTTPLDFDKGAGVSGSVQHFVASLPPEIGKRAHVFSTRIFLTASKR